MIYARVVRALAAVGEDPETHDHDGHGRRIADSLNQEFERLGIQVDPEDLERKSALEIAEVITEKIAA
ncbi:MAG TPA: hypothetical protein VHY22_03145 [Chthoniobacteraceae bacterium]|jgi:5S rRNA maturation endonuclease (ribonuclease M5)|nr:hypothetical protein [Chthoniobacteraceae bacterium]